MMDILSLIYRDPAEPVMHLSCNLGAIKFQGIFVGGFLAGLVSAQLSITITMNWAEHMTSGRCFIAIALLIFPKKASHPGNRRGAGFQRRSGFSTNWVKATM